MSVYKFASLFACALALPAVCSASVVNGDFETGNMSGWTVAGAGTARTSAIGVTPTQATYQGFLESTGNFTATAPVVVASLGIPGSAIIGLGAGTPFNGTGISQSITVAAGDVLSFDWNYASDELDETITYNDFAFFTIDTTAFLLASRNSSTFNLISPPPGFDGQTGWATQSYTFSTAGTYTIGFGSLNVGDAGHNSALFLDQIGIPVPEPTSALIVALAGLMLGRYRKN